MVGFSDATSKSEPLDVVKPMLASKASKEKIEEALDSDHWVAEPKLDGSRYIASFNPEATNFTSRRTSVKTGSPVDKTENVPHLGLAFEPLEGTVLDGEIMRTSERFGTSSDVVKIMGSSPEKAIQRQEESGWVHYHVWDILFACGTDMQKQPYSMRRQVLEKILEEWGNPYVHLVDCRTDKRQLLKEIDRSGLEGIILKNSNSTYVQDKRSPNWIKVKKEQTYDVVITGYDEPKDESKKSDGSISKTRLKEKGWIGAVRFGAYRDGNLIEIGSVSGMDDDIRAALSSSQEKYLGSVIEIRGQEVTADAIRHPRFVRFRDDKDALDCSWSDIFLSGKVEYK